MQRQARQTRLRETREAEAGPTETTTLPAPLHRTLREQRQLLNSLVGLYARQKGEPHGAVHAELRRICGGPLSRRRPSRSCSPASTCSASASDPEPAPSVRMPEKLAILLPVPS